MHVEFHVFEGANQQEARIMLCEFVEKWYQATWRIAIVCASPQEIQLLDQLLWTFSDQSFVPHTTETTLVSAVHLYAHSTVITDDIDVLINLSPDAITTIVPRELLVEIVFSDETMQQLARSHYKLYRDHGYPLKTIKHTTRVSKRHVY